MDNKEHCFACPFCRCSKDMNKFKGIPGIAELGCYTCPNKTCSYLWGEDALKKHLKNVHNIHEPHHMRIDGQIHTIDD